MARAYHNPMRGNGKAAKWLFAHADHSGDDCLIWPFNRMPKGYGMFGYNGDVLYAHRFMCELAHGPAPEDKPQAAHSCGNGHLGCVNPRHLSWASNSENQLDRRVHGTHERTKVHVLTPMDVAEIRALKGKVTQAVLARRFRVKPGTIEYWQRHERPPQRFGGRRRASAAIT